MAPNDKSNKSKKMTNKTTAGPGRVRSSTLQNATVAAVVTLPGPSLEPPLKPVQVRKAAKEKKYAGQSDKEILADQMKNWHSPLYKHFKDPIIEVIKGKVMYWFHCKIFEDSTGNLSDHIKSCTPTTAADQGLIFDYANGHSYSAARFHFLLAMWIARRHHLHKIVNDPELVEIFKMLYSRRSATLHYLYNQRAGDFTSLSMAGVVEEFLLDFIRLTESHTGEYLTQKFVEVLNDFSVAHKALACVVVMNLETPAGRKHQTYSGKCNQTQNLKAGSSKSSLAPPCGDYSFLETQGREAHDKLGVVSTISERTEPGGSSADNAEVNAVMVHHTQWQITTFKGLKYHMNCQDHIWALCIKAFCQQFAAVKGEKITDNDDDQTDEPTADDDNMELSDADHEIEDYLDTFIPLL
ncbi:hypothetical protein ARMSODRAFT_1010481 [Armillaria solidipes]|uniref:Uncharacterized protein n=1 Tax=Armillaria solidipes TaxID=1076256 RepID=A0A2H3CHH1_9AGAR|nr:hypothetical protein ARMSODRAFT_1010481 [Armillaria solidipes]